MATSSLAPLAAGAQSAPATIRVGTVPIDTGMEVHFAEDMGFFERAGLDATIQDIGNGAQITAAVVAGSVDIGFSNLISVVQAYERGIAVVVLFPAAMYLATQPNGGLMVAKDSPIRTARDLAGKTIGISTLGNMTQLAPMVWIDEHGGDSKSVHWLEIPSFPALAAALADHRIDAAFLTEPVFSASKQVDRLLAAAADAISPRFATAAWFSTKVWTDAHPDLATRFVSAMSATAHWANMHPADTVPLIAKVTKVAPDVIARQPPTVYGEGIVPAEFQPLLDASAKYGLIPRPITIDQLVYRPLSSRGT